MRDDQTYTIDVDDSEIVVRLRTDVLSREQVARFLDYLELESIRRRSALSEMASATLSDEIDAAVWERRRSQVETP